MTNIGKISSLPEKLREQVNERLDHAESPESILAWLNSLPEVQAVLARKFKNVPISPQNLSDYKLNSFRNWRTRRDALRFTQQFQADFAELRDLGRLPLSEKLARWASLRYLSLAQTIVNTPDDDPQSELKRLRELTADILALRRSDRLAERAKVARKRFELARDIARKLHGPLRTRRPAPDEITDDEKLDNMRRRMFGVLPEDRPPIEPLVRPQGTGLNSASPSVQPADIQPTSSP